MKSSYLSFEDGMILYLRDPKDSIRKLADLINTCSHVARGKKSSLYKISSIYTTNKFVDEEIRKNRPLTMASKKSNSQE